MLALKALLSRIIQAMQSFRLVSQRSNKQARVQKDASLILTSISKNIKQAYMNDHTEIQNKRLHIVCH